MSNFCVSISYFLSLNVIPLICVQDLNGGRGVKARGNVWEQRALKRHENGRESGQDQVTEQEDPDVVVEGEDLSDKSSCFLSARDSQEEEEEEDILGVFCARREETVRDGSQVGGEVDLITWEDDEDERGKEVVSDDRNECTWNQLLNF